MLLINRHDVFAGVFSVTVKVTTWLVLAANVTVLVWVPVSCTVNKKRNIKSAGNIAIVTDINTDSYRAHQQPLSQVIQWVYQSLKVAGTYGGFVIIPASVSYQDLSTV